MKKYWRFIAIAVFSFTTIAYAEKIDGFVPLHEVNTSSQASPQVFFDETAYSKCILENTKKQSVTSDVRQACKILATPYSCRNLLGNEFMACREQCAKSNTFSKNFGDCRLN